MVCIRHKMLIVLFVALFTCLCPAAGKIKIDFISGNVVAPCKIIIGDDTITSNIAIDLGEDFQAVLHNDFAENFNLKQEDKILFQFETGNTIEINSFKKMDLSSLNFLNYSQENNTKVPFWAIIGAGAFSQYSQLQLDIQQGEFIFGNDLSIAADALEIRLQQDRYGYYADFEPLKDYRLKAKISTGCYDSILDDICADIADMPKNGFDHCLLGGVDISPYAAFKIESYTTKNRDLVAGNNIWQHFKVTFSLTDLKIFLEKKPGLEPDQSLKQYYAYCREKDFENMHKFLRNNPQTTYIRSEIYNLLLYYLNSEDIEYSTISGFIETMFEILPKDIVVDAIVYQLGKANTTKNTKNAMAFLKVTREKIQDCKELTSSKHIIEAYLGDLLTVADEPELGYEYLISALYNQPDNSQINFLVGRYYYNQKQYIRAWYRLMRACLSPRPEPEAFLLLNVLYNLPEFRNSFSMTDTRDLLANKNMLFIPGLNEKKWPENSGGLLEYFIYTDMIELSQFIQTLDAIDRYCPSNSLYAAYYFIDQPEHSSLSSDYGNSLARQYLASGRPALYLNGKSYGFSNKTMNSPERIVDNLYSVRDRFDLAIVDISAQLFNSDLFEVSITVPSNISYSRCELLLIENNILFLYEGKLSTINNLCRFAIDSKGYVGDQIREQYSFEDLHRIYNDRLTSNININHKSFVWKSSILDPRQSSILAKFYDKNGKIVAIGQAEFQIKGAMDDR